MLKPGHSHPSFSCIILAVHISIFILRNAYRSSEAGVVESVDYQTISSRDLAKAVLSQGGWSDLLVQGSTHYALMPVIVLDINYFYMFKGQVKLVAI